MMKSQGLVRFQRLSQWLGLITVILILGSFFMQHELSSKGPSLTGLSSFRNAPAATVRAELGRAGWTVLHRMAAQLSSNATAIELNRVGTFVEQWSELYPCTECAEHFRQLLADFPIDLSSGDAYKLWLCNAHNLVNERLHKRQFQCTLDALAERWGDCGCSE